MAIAPRLKWFLDARGVPYEVLHHPPTHSSHETARSARVAPRQLAKPVLLEDALGYVLAVVPASHRVDLRRLGMQLHRDLELATEGEVASLFPDCDRGAMPPVGSAYRIATVYDDALTETDEVWFEAGDHEDVVRMRTSTFLALLAGCLHGRFSWED
jgi:Ala-tRNA(Pro) deacylase